MGTPGCVLDIALLTRFWRRQVFAERQATLPAGLLGKGEVQIVLICVRHLSGLFIAVVDVQTIL